MEGDNVYRKTELVGSSSTSISDAIETAIARASKTLRNVEWFEVSENPRPREGRQGRPLPGRDEGGLPRRGVTPARVAG